MQFTTLHQISNLIAARKYAAAARHIDTALDTEPGPNWHRDLGKLASFLRDPRRVPFSPIFAQGNGKLPFLSFSVLFSFFSIPTVSVVFISCSNIV